MRIYLISDLEGVAGVDQWDPHTYATAWAWDQKREMVDLMAGEINAAIEGALAAGAREVWVNDSHGSGTNIPPAQLHPEARLIRGGPRPRWLPDLDAGIDALLFIGLHAMEGTPGAVLAHSWSSHRRRRCFLNGQEIGEIGTAIYMAAAHGARTVFLSGDEAAVSEIRALLPKVECVSVKQGFGEKTANHLSPEHARRRIRAGVERALKQKESGLIELPEAPYVFRQEFEKPPWRGLLFAVLRLLGPRGARLLLHQLKPGRRLHSSVRFSIKDFRTLEYRGEDFVTLIDNVLC